MQQGRTLLVARRVAQQILADRRTLALLFVVPVMVILLLGLVLRAGAGSFRLLLVPPILPPQIELEAPRAPRDLPVELKIGFAAEDEARRALERGEAAGALFLTKGDDGMVIERLLLEGSNVQANQAIRAFTVRLAALPAAPVTVLDAPLPEAPMFPIEYLRAGPQLDLVDSIAPAFIAFFAFFFVFLLTTVALVRERTSGTLERLMATPLGKSELVAGYSIGLGAFALVQALVVTGLSIVALQLDVFGNLGVVFLIVALLTAGAVNLGILASSFARNEFQAVQFIPIVILPQALLSGAFWPLDGMPGWAQGLARAFPLTYAQEAMRAVMVSGHGITDFDVYARLLVLVGFALAFAILGAGGLRRHTA